MTASAVPAVRVVPALDVAEDGQPALGLSPEPAPVEQFALEGGEELSAIALS